MSQAQLKEDAIAYAKMAANDIRDAWHQESASEEDRGDILRTAQVHAAMAQVYATLATVKL